MKISKYRPSIFQSKLDFSVAHEMVLPGEWTHERTALRSTIAVLAMLAFLYLYFVTASVLNVIASKDAGREIVKLGGSIGTLEQEYFALSQEATPENGARLGLVEVGDTAYVYRPGNVGAVTIRSNAN